MKTTLLPSHKDPMGSAIADYFAKGRAGTDYLSEVSLLTDQDTDKEGDTEKITLMTIHSAKGLEFKNVFIVGLEENLFPSQLSMNSYCLIVL